MQCSLGKNEYMVLWYVNWISIHNHDVKYPCVGYSSAVRSAKKCMISIKSMIFGRLSAYGRRQTAYGRRQTAYGRRQTAYGRRQTAYRKSREIEKIEGPSLTLVGINGNHKESIGLGRTACGGGLDSESHHHEH